MEEIELDDIFKKVNPGAAAPVAVAGDDNGAGGTSDPDGSQIQVKSAKELESAAAIGKKAEDDDDADDSASVDGNPTDVNDLDDDVYNAEVINTLYQVIAEKSGIDMSSEDIKSPEELIDAIEDIISKKSTPKYSSELSEEFDKFIREGGDPIEFLSAMDTESSTPKIDTQKEKEEVVRTVLRDAGFSDKQIEKKIDSYIENDTLDDEALDAADIVKRKNAKNVEGVIKAKKAEEARQIKEQEELYNSIEDFIDNMKDVRGIPITADQKKNAKEYFFKVDKKTGITGYQRDFGVKNLVESIFFTQNGNALLKAAESKGSSDAISKLKSVLKTNKIAGTQQNNRQGQGDSLAPWLAEAAALSGRAA